MDRKTVKIGDAVRGSLVPDKGGAAVLDTLSNRGGRMFWYDTNGRRHYENGGLISVYVATVRTDAFGEDGNGKRHALLPHIEGEPPRGMCADSQGKRLAVWETGIALAAVSCGGCRLSLGLTDTWRPFDGERAEIRYEVDGETVTGGEPGEAWYAIYTVPATLAAEPITEAEAEAYGPPRFEKREG